jgi:hypothetical protein
MLSLFRSKQQPTLKARVHEFWKWYTKAAPRFYKTIESKKCADLAPEVISKIDELLPGFAWTFGPGEKRGDHSFTLTGEGDLHRQIVSRYWAAQAPSLSGWTFYPSRQPGGIDGRVIDIGDRRFDPIEFWITPDLDHEAEKVDLVVWHPLFGVLEERDRWTILFLFLDEVLGEYGTQQWIGDVKLHDKRLAEAIPLKELLPWIKKIEVETGWKKHPTGTIVTVYKFEEQMDGVPRGDIFVGSSSNMKLVSECRNGPDSFKNPLAKFGVDYVFVAFDATFLPRGEETTARGEIEDALEKTLTSEASGQVLGGAMGRMFAYIDLVLFDGSASLDLVERTLRQRKLPPGTSVHFFSNEKGLQPLVI